MTKMKHAILYILTLCCCATAAWAAEKSAPRLALISSGDEGAGTIAKLAELELERGHEV